MTESLGQVFARATTDLIDARKGNLSPMTDTPVHTEQITDNNGTYTQEWYCEPPPARNAYHVTRATWSPDGTVRKIYEIKLGEHW